MAVLHHAEQTGAVVGVAGLADGQVADGMAKAVEGTGKGGCAAVAADWHEVGDRSSVDIPCKRVKACKVTILDGL